MIIKSFLKKKLSNASLAAKLINCRYSSFSIDNAYHFTLLPGLYAGGGTIMLS